MQAVLKGDAAHLIAHWCKKALITVKVIETAVL